MTPALQLVVPASLDGMRVDRAIALLTGVSRTVAAGLVAGGQVVVDGRPAASRRAALRAGDQLSVDMPEAGAPTLVPDPAVEIAVVHADDDVVVVDKAPGVVVHPGNAHATGTLVAGLLARYPDMARLAGDPCDPLRPGVVHRLDRGTSGLLVFARSAAAFRSLGAQMRERTVGRRYVALVAGHVADDRGMVDAPIGRSARTPTRMAVSAAGRPARTVFEVVTRLELATTPGTAPVPATLLSCRLETGRTHQIRVHLAAIGHPVAGDDRYGTGRRRVMPGLLPPGRLFLHAAALSFDHPATGCRVGWESPLPADLALALGRAA